LGFFITGLDKRWAKTHHRRIPEKTLFMFALAGGAIGVYLGMKVFRHKIRKIAFFIGIPVIIFVNLLVFHYLYNTINLQKIW